MEYVTVRFEKPLKQNELEFILTKAGNDMGWKPEKHEKYRTVYKIGSFEELEELTDSTLQFFEKRFFRNIKKLQIEGIYNIWKPKILDSPVDSIKITSSPLWDYGNADAKEIKQFVKKIGEYTEFFHFLGKINNYFSYKK